MRRSERSGLPRPKIPAAGPLLALVLALLAGPAGAADLEATLNSRWRGAWAVVLPAIASNCDGFYNDNEVVGGRVDSGARRRFEGGELAHVERIAAKRNRLDVFLDLAEGVLETRRDGPFTLYEPRTCRVQLKVPLDGPGDAAAAESRLESLLERHDKARQAEASPAWNGRRREPFPEGYERTLAAYESWKAAQTNAAVQARMERAIEEAARVKEHIRSDAEYLEGFADGVEKARDRSFGDCDDLTGSSFSPASGSRGGDFRRGYEDGQVLAYDLELLRRLKDCFVPVPPPEAGDGR